MRKFDAAVSALKRDPELSTEEVAAEAGCCFAYARSAQKKFMILTGRAHANKEQSIIAAGRKDKSLTAEEISALTGAHYSYVRSVLRKHGLKIKSKKKRGRPAGGVNEKGDAYKAVADALKRGGKINQADFARRLGVSRQRINQIVLKLQKE